MSTLSAVPSPHPELVRRSGARRIRRIAFATAVAVVVGLSPSGLGVADAAEASAPMGFGAETTGGASGGTSRVTNLNDEGPGSLRAAAEQARARVIKFRVSGEIVLSRPLMVGPDKTIDGAGRKVTIKNRGFVLEQSNVIIRHLTFSDIGVVTEVDNPEDAILISGAQNVWIDHNTMLRAGDKLIGIPKGDAITISWNHFLDQGQVIQIGTTSTAQESAYTRVTIHHNDFDGGYDRSPQASYGKVHAYNNYVRDWRYKGMSALRGAELLSENNVFMAGANKKAITFDTENPDQRDPYPGYVRSEGDLLLNGALVRQNEPQTVFDPSSYYDVAVQAASTALASEIRQGAGA